MIKQNLTVAECIQKNQPFCHFSVDDVWQIFNQKDDEGFKFLKSLYDEFGLITALYVFSQPKGIKYLTKIPSGRFSDCFWLKFGPHAPAWERPMHTLLVKEQIDDVDYVYKEIERIAGKEFLTENVTLNFYKGSKEVCQHLAKLGVKVFFTQDFHHQRMSYFLPPASRDPLNNKGFYYDKETGLLFVKTSLCVEFRDDIEKDTNEYLDRHGFCKIYTHEKFLTDPVVQNKIRTVLNICKKKNIPFVV